MYGLITYIRNVLFDKGVLKTQHHNIPVLSVGNLKAGGTGKTPFVEYLLRTFSSSFNIAVVSRGYGRK
ncbi:MAG: tetraacyldisaccharide 4'-kinase, partial [Bacteroidales bacterium]|nr:tetraacyldisaccharide 4'-kinase [Bacteroidales bacterium]